MGTTNQKTKPKTPTKPTASAPARGATKADDLSAAMAAAVEERTHDLARAALISWETHSA